jgi:hypothetical protein
VSGMNVERSRDEVEGDVWTILNFEHILNSSCTRKPPAWFMPDKSLGIITIVL